MVSNRCLFTTNQIRVIRKKIRAKSALQFSEIPGTFATFFIGTCFCCIMSAQVKKSFAWTWMVALLIATMGVSVHQMYCYCAGIGSVSLFAMQDKCEGDRQTEAAKPSCCTKKMAAKPSCCEKGAQGSKKGKHGCTKKSTRVFQLKTEFTIQEKVTELFPELTLDQDLTAIPPFPVFTPVPANPKIVFQLFAHPPPLSGRMICVRHGVFLC